MIYTTYFANMNNIPSDAIKIAICNTIPKFISDRVTHIPELGPDPKDLGKYRAGKMALSILLNRYSIKLTTDPTAIAILNRILEVGRTGKDIYLVCYEKDREKCHRSLLGSWFTIKGMEVRELESSHSRYDNSPT